MKTLEPGTIFVLMGSTGAATGAVGAATGVVVVAGFADVATAVCGGTAFC